jgi:hypothetical protein
MMQITKNSRLGWLLETAASLAWTLPFVVGFVCLAIGYVHLADLPQGTWPQYFLSALFATAVVIASITVMSEFQAREHQWEVSVRLWVMYVSVAATLPVLIRMPVFTSIWPAGTEAVYQYRLYPVTLVLVLALGSWTVEAVNAISTRVRKWKLRRRDQHVVVGRSKS